MFLRWNEMKEKGGEGRKSLKRAGTENWAGSVT